MRARPWIKAHSPSKCQHRLMMLILSEQVTASSHHILPRPVFPASREAKKTYIDRESYKRKELDESSDFIYVQFSCTSIIHHVQGSVWLITTVHASSSTRKELVYMNHMNWPQKKGITINSLQESASTMPVLLLSLFPCETRSPIKQSLLARA